MKKTTDELIKELCEAGANRSRLKAKIAGGAQMFAFESQQAAMRVGLANVDAVREKLKKEGIPIVAEDTGGSHGRTIAFYPESGKLSIRAFDHPELII